MSGIRTQSLGLYYKSHCLSTFGHQIQYIPNLVGDLSLLRPPPPFSWGYTRFYGVPLSDTFQLPAKKLSRPFYFPTNVEIPIHEVDWKAEERPA